MHPILSLYEVAKGPDIVNLSLLSFICHRCEGIYCPIGKTVIQHPGLQHAMDLSIVEQVLRDLEGFSKLPVLRLLPHGELAEYPQISELAGLLMRYASHFPIVANTNGVLLQRLKSLLPSLTILEISINAVSEKEYRAIRPGAQSGDYERIVRETREIAAQIHAGKLKLKLVVSFLRYPGINDTSWEEFRQTWADLGAEPILRECHSFSNYVPQPPKTLPEPLPPCKSLFTRMTIASDGTFIRCYNDIFKTDKIGRLNENFTLQDLWYSEANLEGMLIMLGEETGRIFCSDCRDRVCADPRTQVGTGQPFEYHARTHHASIWRQPRENWTNE